MIGSDETDSGAVPQTGGDLASQDLPAQEARVDRKLLELLVCPLTKDRLDYDAQAKELISRRARLAYPIRDGIPIMLPDEARRLD